ncbi:MAG TPA: EAL domain-containing protein [Anaeromyxobacteraceae bacterium]|nr:EAL domain-containing protein [Anaeromyxobacteraceae bacterium]
MIHRHHSRRAQASAEPPRSRLPVPVPSSSDVLASVLGRCFAVEYQPIIDLATGATIAHEALSRFFDVQGRPVPPGAVFARLHEDPSLLLYVEAETKRFQIENAPDGPLHLNVDPDSFHAGRNGQDNALLDVLQSHSAPVVVEVIETMTFADARLGRELVQALRARHMVVALDDVGAPDTLISLEVLKDADVLKLDASWFTRIADPRERAILDALLTLARRLGARTVLEGVETRAQLETAAALGVDAVQGFLYRGQFTTRAA